MATINELYDHYLKSGKSNPEFLDYISNNYNSKYINDVDDYQQTVLHHAAYQDDIDTVRLLLEKNANIHVKDKGKCTPLARCLIGPDINISLVRLLLQHGANIDETDKRGFTALHWSVLAGNLIKSLKLLALGADINRVNHNLETPLRLALSRDIPHKTEMINLLLHKSTIISQDFTGITLTPGLTDNIIVIGSTIHSDSLVKINNITRKTPGFEHAITNFDDFKKAIDADIVFNYYALENATRGKTNPDLKAIHQQAILLGPKVKGNITATKHSLARGLAEILLVSRNQREKQALDTKIKTMPKDIQDLIQEEINLLTGEK